MIHLDIIIKIKRWFIRFIVFLQSIFMSCASSDIFIIKDFGAYYEILSQDITSRSNDLDLGNLFDRYLGKCLGSLDSRDPKWGKLKKIFKPIFNSSDTNDKLDDIIKEWDNHLTSVFEKTLKTENCVSIYEIANDIPLNFILYLTFGKDFVKNNDVFFNELKK